MDPFHDLPAIIKNLTLQAPSNHQLEQVKSTLKKIKDLAVAQGNQECAKKVWCYEQILLIQTTYVSAFRTMKNGSYYEAWCLLERVEIALNSLLRHFSGNRNADEYKINFIDKHTKQFQSLFPYKLFLSPALLELEKECSICQKPVSIRNSCGHTVGEIYNGEECLRKITKLKVLEISVVRTPLQKYSVLFPSDPKTGNREDSYNYTPVKYVLDRLSDPFDAWDIQRTKISHPHSHYQHINKDDPCPCESGKEYKGCCLSESGVLRPHLEIIFHVEPPKDSINNICYF
jgi:hypothetical protein